MLNLSTANSLQINVIYCNKIIFLIPGINQKLNEIEVKHPDKIGEIFWLSGKLL